MSAVLLILFIILFLTITYYGIILYKNKTSWAVLPPGPRGIPILGNLHQIAKNAPLKFSQWAQEHGNLYTLNFAGKPVLVVNDAALIKQVFGMPAATGRFNSDLFDITYEGYYGIINSEGAIWQEQRAFFAQTVRKFSKTPGQMESFISEEIDDLMDWIQRQMRGSIHFSERLKMTLGNILWSVVVGERGNTIIAELVEEYMILLNKAASRGLAFFSWLRYFAPKWTGYTDFVLAARKIREFVQKYFDDPQGYGGSQENVISAYIDRVKNTEDERSSFYGEEGMKHSFGSVLGLMLAGMETTATTMHWLIFYLAAHPEVQSKMRKEIDEVTGEHRNPVLEDRKRMPYSQAVIEETLRMSSMTPFGVIQVLLEDVSFLQYKLPKGLLLIANIFHVHNNPEVWGDPENFRPERFLETEKYSKNERDSETKMNLKENVVSFQPGRRACPGESLARDIIFLFATKLGRKFQFSLENGRSKGDYLQPDIGYTLAPKKLGVVACER